VSLSARATRHCMLMTITRGHSDCSVEHGIMAQAHRSSATRRRASSRVRSRWRREINLMPVQPAESVVREQTLVKYAFK